MPNPVKYYRLSRWLFTHGIPVLPNILDHLNTFLFHCYIPHSVEAGEGLELAYWGLGIVIHPKTKIGNNVFIGQQVTIGGRSGNPNLPRIGDNVLIATGAKVLGDIEIGSGSIIGANAVVINSVPPRSIVAGVPARVIRQNIDIRQYISDLNLQTKGEFQ
jgi:serine O-acetyltransferase